MGCGKFATGVGVGCGIFATGDLAQERGMMVAEEGTSGGNGPYVTLYPAGSFEVKRYRLLPHNIRTLKDVRAVFEVLNIRLHCWEKDKDWAKKYPHLFTEE